MNRNHRETFAGILIVIIVILLGITTERTSGFLGLIVGIFGLVFFFVGAYLIHYFIVDEPESEVRRIREEYEEKAKQNITKKKNN